MKRILLVYLFVSSNVFALNISSSEAITALLTKNEEVAQWLEKHTDRGQVPQIKAYNNLSARTLAFDDKLSNGKTVYENCVKQVGGSRSASYAEVKIEGVYYANGIARFFSKTLVLATPYQAADFKVCQY